MHKMYIQYMQNEYLCHFPRFKSLWFYVLPLEIFFVHKTWQIHVGCSSSWILLQVPELEERLREIQALMGAQDTTHHHHQENEQLNSD